MAIVHGALRSSACIAAALLTGCGFSNDAPTAFTHVNLADHPDQLRLDFNAHSDQVRLVFIVGPT